MKSGRRMPGDVNANLSRFKRLFDVSLPEAILLFENGITIVVFFENEITVGVYELMQP